MRARGNRIEVFPGRRRGEWFYRVVSVNGQKLATSEAFTRRRDAHRAALRLFTNPPREVRVVDPSS